MCTWRNRTLRIAVGGAHVQGGVKGRRTAVAKGTLEVSSWSAFFTSSMGVPRRVNTALLKFKDVF